MNRRAGGSPPAPSNRRTPAANAFAKGRTLHNAERALEKVAARLQPLDFDVDFAIPTPEEIGGARRRR